MTRVLWGFATAIKAAAMTMVVHATTPVAATLPLTMRAGRQGPTEDNIYIIARRMLDFAVLWHLLFQVVIWPW